jgi:hypothetical protein
MRLVQKGAKTGEAKNSGGKVVSPLIAARMVSDYRLVFK